MTSSGCASQYIAQAHFVTHNVNVDILPKLRRNGKLSDLRRAQKLRRARIYRINSIYKSNKEHIVTNYLLMHSSQNGHMCCNKVH